MSEKLPPSSFWYPLFEHMAKEHGLTLTDSELSEIARVATMNHQKHLGQFVLNRLEEVTNNVGGVIGYKLTLNAEETEKLCKLIESK